MTQGMTIKEIPSAVRRRRIFSEKCITTSVVCMTVSSLVVFIIFWCTNVFENAILSSLAVRSSSPMLDRFLRPPMRAVYRIRIFNYTNVDDFESGKAKKLQVQEAGPYIYRETLTRVNHVFHANGSISFQEKRSYQWEGGSPDDEIIVVPNVPLFASMAFMRDLNFVAQLAFTGVLTTLQTKTFVPLTAGGFLWGYHDDIFELAKPFIAWQENIPFDKFGVLAYKNGLSDTLMMNTGVEDMNKLAMIERVNGLDSRPIWHDDKCDRVYGTEGFMFPSSMMNRPNATIDVYSVDMCRTLRLHEHGTGSSFGIPTRTFKPSPDTFTSSPDKDYCYCPEITPGDEASRKCPPAGIFNGSACSFNMPVLGSFPHFYAGDESLLKNIDGLNPQAHLHESAIELHPRLGVLIGGHSRIQMNVEARRAIGVPYLGEVEDGQILPLIWIEVGVDSIPESLLTIFKHAYYTAAATEAGLRWASVLGLAVSTCFLLYYLKQQLRNHHATLRRNPSGQNKLLETETV